MLFFILLSLVLLSFCLYFYIDNKRLKEMVNKLELENKTILERKLVSSKEDLVSIANISIPKDEVKLNKRENLVDKRELYDKHQTEITTKRVIDNKYIARTNEDEVIVPNIPNPTSSILADSIDKYEKRTLNKVEFKKNMVEKSESIPKENLKNNSTVSMDIDFNPNEFIKTAERVVNSVNVNKSYKNDEYLKEIAKQLESEIVPQTVNLTDYEKDQEENAVISYKELLSLKEQGNNQDEKNKTFLEDLKALRNLLDQNT